MGLGGVVEPSPLAAEPGQVASGDVRVTNSGPARQQVTLKVVGDTSAWAWCVPGRLTVEPGGTAVARISFRPPRAPEPAAGPFSYRLELRTAASSPDGPVVVDGTLEIAPFSELLTSLAPPISHGRHAGEHVIHVDNRGNAPVTAELAVGPGGAGGADVEVSPTMLTLAPGEEATARVTVTPRQRLLFGGSKPRAFQVDVRPSGASPVAAAGIMRQEAALGGAWPKAAAGGLAVLVVGALLWTTVLSGVPGTEVRAGGSDTTTQETVAPIAVDPLCPAGGHKDPGASGFSDAEQIRQLLKDFSFTFVGADGCTPARFNPCEPIHYVMNAAQAPPDGPADVREAFSRISRATGLSFVDDGATTERFGENRSPYQPARYGERWAPVFITWEKLTGGQGDIQVVGRGRPTAVNNVLVTGMLALNIDAVTDAEERTPLEGGFGPAGGFSRIIGPDGVTWGRVILHELAHVMNLGHVGDPAQIMYPETAKQTARFAEFGRGDLAGLQLLGAAAGCVTVPTPGPGAGPAGATGGVGGVGARPTRPIVTTTLHP